MAGVDVEAMVIGILLDDAGMISLVGDRVYHRMPQNPRYPLMLVRRYGGTTDHIGHLDSASVQFNAIDHRDDVAREVAAEALAVMLRTTGVYSEGVLNGARPLAGLRYQVDPVTSYPMYLVDLSIYAHPNAA